MRITVFMFSILTSNIVEVFAWTQSSRNVSLYKAGSKMNDKTELRTKQISDDDGRIEILRSELEFIFSKEPKEFSLHKNDPSSTSISSSNFGDWIDASPCRGEECEQCEIPDEFKSPETFSPVDVMAILGIHRAEPIRIHRK